MEKNSLAQASNQTRERIKASTVQQEKASLHQNPFFPLSLFLFRLFVVLYFHPNPAFNPALTQNYYYRIVKVIHVVQEHC